MFQACWRKFDLARLQVLVLEKAYPATTIAQFLSSHTNRKIFETAVRAQIMGELPIQADELIAYADLYEVPVDFLTRPRFGGVDVATVHLAADFAELVKQLATDPRRKRVRRDYIKQKSLASFRRFWYIRRSRKRKGQAK